MVKILRSLKRKRDQEQNRIADWQKLNKNIYEAISKELGATSVQISIDQLNRSFLESLTQCPTNPISRDRLIFPWDPREQYYHIDNQV